MSGVCSIWHIHHPRGQVTLGAFIAIVSPNPWQMKLAQCERALHPFQGWGITSVQWAPHPSWERRFTQCAVGPSSLLRMRFRLCAVSPSSLLKEEVYPVCSRPLILPERWGLSSVQPAPHPFWEMKYTQCATSPSSLSNKVYQCAISPSSFLREEVYLVCSGPFIPLGRGGLPSVQWAPHSFWERRFTKCAVGPSSLLGEEVYPVCSGPLIHPERGSLPSVQWALHPFGRGGLPSVQWAPHSSWKRKFTECAVGPSSLSGEEVYPVCSGPLIHSERGGLPSVQ